MRGSQHVHSFIWILKLSEETLGTYTEFIENTIHANLPAPDDGPGPYKLVNQYQTHKHSESWRN